MMDLPLVSVIVATYNQEKSVEEALTSILNQTYRNVEIIVSDDASVDRTSAILTKLAAKNPTLLLFLQEKNLGITDNYNFLAEKARGKYVSYFSGDDVMCERKIELQVNALEKNLDASFCHHAVYSLNASNGKVRGIISQKYLNDVTTVHDILRNLGVPGSMSIMNRRSLAKNPVFDRNIRTASDWLFLIHLAMVGKGIYIDSPLCYYRQDDAYNNKDTSKYEADFRKTIELTKATYANAGDAIDQSCDYAEARYALGAGFRSLLNRDIPSARRLFSSKMFGVRLVVLSKLLLIISYLPNSPTFLLNCKKLFKAIQRS